MSAANQRTMGADSYARLIGSIAVSFLIMLFAYVAQALACAGGVVNYRFWLNTAGKLPLLPQIKSHFSHPANSSKHSAVLPAAATEQQARAAAAPRLPKVKNTRYTPVRLQQAVLGVQRA